MSFSWISIPSWPFSLSKQYLTVCCPPQWHRLLSQRRRGRASNNSTSFPCILHPVPSLRRRKGKQLDLKKSFLFQEHSENTDTPYMSIEQLTQSVPVKFFFSLLLLPLLLTTLILLRIIIRFIQTQSSRSRLLFLPSPTTTTT